MTSFGQRFAGSFRGWLFRDSVAAYRPLFDERELFVAIPACRAKARAGGDNAPGAVSQNDSPKELRRSLARHFRHRRAPLFFADAMGLSALAKEVSVRHPAWLDRTLDIVVRDRSRGLRIYSAMGPALAPGFPWCTLPRGPGRDILYAVRPHRFAFAPRLALAVLYGYVPALALAEILEDWMASAERSRSELPYCSTLVVAQRLLALSWALAFAGSAPEADTSDGIRAQVDILRIIHADIRYLLPRLGASYPNNHLLADRFVAWYLRLLFPEFVPAPVELERHEAEWAEELARQTYRDGTGFEHSLHYHELACEMAAAYVILARRNARQIAPETMERIERMLAFQVGLAGPSCVTVPFGNATEDPLFPLDSGEGWATGGLRELYRALFRPDLRPADPDDPTVERGFWLLGGAMAPEPPRPASETSVCLWPDGGFCVFPERAGEARLVFRTGPAKHCNLLGGHMHSDLLTLCLNVGSQPILVDPGTWSYRLQAEPISTGRRYLVGPEAHNGLTLKGVDPLGKIGGDFRDSNVPIRVRTLRHVTGNSISWVEAEIEGDSPYAGYRRGVVHVHGEYWVVYQRLPTGFGNEATVSFQVSSDVPTSQDSHGTCWIEAAETSIWITSGPGLRGPAIRCGSAHPPGGWVAPRYGELIPAPQIFYEIEPGCALTAVVMGIGVNSMRPVSAEALRGGVAIRIEGSGGDDLLLLGGSPDAEIRSGSFSYCGNLLWLRRTQLGPLVVRSLGLRTFGASEERLNIEAIAGVDEVELRVRGDEFDVKYCDPQALLVRHRGRCRGE